LVRLVPVSLLAIALGYALESAAVGQQPQPQQQYAAVLVTKNMCCAHESVPAIKELSRVPGIGRVTADHEKRTLLIAPRANTAPSPRAIWEAAERAKIEPIQLATPQGVFKSKPLR
jgi:copper chaperone CopZ